MGIVTLGSQPLFLQSLAVGARELSRGRAAAPARSPACAGSSSRFSAGVSRVLGVSRPPVSAVANHWSRLAHTARVCLAWFLMAQICRSAAMPTLRTFAAPLSRMFSRGSEHLLHCETT